MNRSLALRGIGLAMLIASATAQADGIKSLTVCADPGNMPLSNQNGEGFENKIAVILGEAIGANVQYYWRPSIERGLMRTTLSEGNCDVWMDMASDTEGAVLTAPLYRSTFVFVYRKDKGFGTFKTMNDPRLQNLRIGVFQVSAARQALAQHGIMAKTVIHYLSHNGDLVAENQPSYQVQQMINGQLDIAAAWGPMAGYYRTIKAAPLVVQPLNTIDDTVPLEFDMALAVPRGRPEIKAAVEKALRDNRAGIRKILDAYGVPLVQCADCIVSGNLPSHGPYKPLPIPVEQPQTAQQHDNSIDELKRRLKDGAEPNDELANAIVARDTGRITYLLAHGADPNSHFNDGSTALVDATRFGFDELIDLLLAHRADVNLTDSSGWTPLLYAAWDDDADAIHKLVAKGADREHADAQGRTPLTIAAQNGKSKAAAALLAAGADVNHAAGKGGYTPLMLATTTGATDIAALLLDRGAHVDAKNSGGVTALMIAAAGDRDKIGELLLRHGADATVKSDDGRTALSIAQANNSDAVTRLLSIRKKGGKQPG
ncbi:MAG: quinoprotein dehydrogenase-associated putative ABC transporter substrate-binding protein [Rudaea sp.]